MYSEKNSLFNRNLKNLLNDMVGQINNQNNTPILKTPVLTYGSSAPAKIKNNAFDVVRDGVLKTIATAETALTATTHNIADGSGAVFLVYLDADDDIKILKGDSTVGGTGAVCPDTPEGGLKIGEVKVVMSGGAFVAATTSLNDGTGLTATFTNSTDVAPALATYEPKHWLHQTNLRTLLDAINALNIGSGEVKMLSNPTIAIGSASKAKVKHGDITYIKDGVISTVAGGEVEFTATTHDITSAEAKEQEAQYLVYLDGSDVKILKGTTADADASALPALPTGKIRLGSCKVVVDAGTDDFDASTDLLDAGHLTTTFTTSVDVMSDFSLSYAAKNYLYQFNLLQFIEGMVSSLNFMNKNKVLGNPTLARGSNNTGVAHAAFTVLKNGTFVTKGAESTGVALTATTHNVAAGKARRFNVHLNADNNVAFLAGDAVDVANHANAVCPATPANSLKIGELVIRNASAGVFTAATTHLNATDITTNYINKVDMLDLIA
jgi:hypothetical protein